MTLRALQRCRLWSTMGRHFAILSIFAVGMITQGCGPVTAHSSIARAHIAIKAAEGARAQELAIFEYESSRLYLKKAKLEEGLSSFQSAIDLARLSRQFADKARARALKSSQARPLTPTERRRQMMNSGAGTRPSPPSMAPVMPTPTGVTPSAPSMGGR